MVGQREWLIGLAGAGAAMYALSSLQLNHLVAALVVSLWVLAALWWKGQHASSAQAQAQANDDASVAGLRHLPMNSQFVDIMSSIAPLKRFDRARFRELGVALDAFQKQYVYTMSGRQVADVDGLKDASVGILRLCYSLYVVVPRVGKHFYGDGSLWEALDAAVARLRDVLTSMIDIVRQHVVDGGGQVPNVTGQEPANRMERETVGGDLP